MSPIDTSELPGKLSADELILIAMYRQCSPTAKDDVRRFAYASMKGCAASPATPDNVIIFPGLPRIA